eukprot:tig00000217_g19175.t1
MSRRAALPPSVLAPPVISPIAPPPNPPKERKPYTITKQRENWTEEEHQKFLEALKLYERDWKKIENYIGTKSVVQIRSHAQKFFLKVQKNGTGEHVPPPRPKRKSAQPYPQKTGQPQLTDQQRLAQEQAEQEQLVQAQKLLNDYMTAASAQTAQATGEPVRGPDFHRIYAFLGSLFDPSQSMQDVVGALQGMSMVDRETAHVLMHNLSVNLSNDQIRHNVVAHLSFHQQTIAMNQQILAGQPVTINPSVVPQSTHSAMSSAAAPSSSSSAPPPPAPPSVMGPPPPPGAAPSAVSGATPTVVQLSPAAASATARPGAVTTIPAQIRSVQVPPAPVAGRSVGPPAAMTVVAAGRGGPPAVAARTGAHVPSVHPSGPQPPGAHPLQPAAPPGAQPAPPGAHIAAGPSRPVATSGAVLVRPPGHSPPVPGAAIAPLAAPPASQTPAPGGVGQARPGASLGPPVPTAPAMLSSPGASTVPVAPTGPPPPAPPSVQPVPSAALASTLMLAAVKPEAAVAVKVEPGAGSQAEVPVVGAIPQAGAVVIAGAVAIKPEPPAA